VAAWLVWKERLGQRALLPLALFGAQLVLNGLWSWLFFGLRRPDLALADIVALWLAIAATTVAFWGVRPVAGALLLPYLAWVTFATALNADIWRRNG
jgi:tryptophan-rich sensory protein